jgi:hypothetical protein
MSEAKHESDKPHEEQHAKSQEGSKNIECIGRESYQNELMLNSKSMQRMQDFIRNLDVDTASRM